MPRKITYHTIFNLEKDRQQQYNEDYELMFDLCEATGCKDIPEQMKKLYELIVENENKDGYILLAEIQDEEAHTHILVGKYMDKKEMR